VSVALAVVVVVNALDRDLNEVDVNAVAGVELGAPVQYRATD
jgi:hypothetical protein